MSGFSVLSSLALLVFLASQTLGFENDIESCQSSLGMESREIPDSSIKASSSYEEVIVGPLNSRIRTERFGGAWCPKSMISRDVYEWLQIDFADLTVVTAVETQGRYGNGQGQEYTPNYMVEYQKRDGDRLWRRYRDVTGQELIKGNNETQMAEKRILDPFIVARKIRFVPFSYHPRAVCMRVELYGCVWKDGLVSYDMRQGDARGDDLDFSDFLYDGFQKDGQLSDGLGQLTDKRTGQSNFRQDTNGTGRRGFEWVGWRRRGTPPPPPPPPQHHPDQIEIRFRFDSVRNFSAVRIHANNMFSRDVRLFSSAELHFSVGGRHFDQLQPPIRSIQSRDDDDEDARYVTITIANYAARFVTLVLHFDARWMMISEVEFTSELAIGNFSDEIQPLETTAASTLSVQSDNPLPEMNFDWSDEEEANQSKDRSQYFQSDSDVDQISHEGDSEDNGEWPPSDFSTFPVATSADRTLQTSYLAALIGTVIAVVIVTAVACTCLGVWYRRRMAVGKYSSSAFGKNVFVVERCRLDPSGGGTGGAPGLPPHAKKNGAAARPASRLVQEAISERLMRDLCVAGEAKTRRSLPPLPSVYQSPDEVDDDDVDRWNAMDVNDLNFPSERIRPIEHLGQGDYAEIRVCELKRTTSPMTSADLRASDVTDEPLLVILKSLKHDASIQDRKEFEEEAKRAFRFNHRNVVRFFGLNGSDSRLEMVLEYSKYGTLHQFLQQRTTAVSTSDVSSKYQPPFSHGYLIYMATEIASGMKYLETCSLVHRDLATRNCLVSNELTIKVTDMASACHRYSSHYYHVPGNRTTIPIRWMAWESVLLRNFTSQSDIWAFGVTLWEILTCARTLPFDHLSDQQVIDNCCHYYQSDGMQQRLSQPTGCTKEMYDLMAECWTRDSSERPTFKEIHLFLSRKNLGFNPYEEHVNGF